MTNSNKKDDKKQKEEENENSQSKEASSEDKSNEDIDYKSKLEKERKKRKQAEYNIEQAKKEKKQVEKKMEETGLSREEVKQMLDDKIDSLRGEINKSQLESELDRVASSEDEREYIKEIYNNRIRKTGNHKEDVENAKMIANKDKFKGQISELKRSNKSKNNRSKGSGPGKKKGQNAKPQISAQDKKVLDRARAKYDPEKEGWVFPNTGKVWRPDRS